MSARNIIVVKLGGSLASSHQLAGWIDALAACGGRAVVVPGGGPFADAVRDAQAAIGFDDTVAHHLALLAMEQFGRVLAALRPGFVMAASPGAIEAALAAGLVPIWAPAEMALAAADIPSSWDVTSDSLAAWLAARLDAACVLLVKHGKFAAESLDATELVRQGVVDPSLPRYLSAGGVPGFIVGAEEAVAVSAAIGQGRIVGAPIAPRDAAAEQLEAS